jgi:oxygen-independent coproporphyrinogen-3 oxidase
MLAPDMDPYSLYIHIPFCRHRCSYCDFNTFAGQERQISAYVQALCSEIGQVGEAGAVHHAVRTLPVHTIFFGGGTPSLLLPEQIGQILAAARESFSVAGDAEITMEANPGTVTPETLAGYRALGVNRLSFGMQSAHPDDLRLLERQHDYLDVMQAVRWARQTGFQNLSLDLIFALPGQSLSRWKDTIQRALAPGPDHLSLYNLTIEHGTPLQRRWERGLIPLVDDDLAADMYEYAMDVLPETGYTQYEISNWARTGPDGQPKTCLHNLQYWRGLPYLGLGAGAHGYAAGARTANVGGIRPYIERCLQASKQQAGAQPEVPFPSGPAVRRTLHIRRTEAMKEYMMVGLRLTDEGVSERAFAQAFGAVLTEIFPTEITRLVRLGLLEWREADADRRLRLTRRGCLVGNQVFMAFIGESERQRST